MMCPLIFIFWRYIMTTITNEIRLVIHLEGGIIQAVYADSGTTIKVAIQDLDIDGADQDEMAMLDDGTEFVGHIEPIVRNNAHVMRVFAALGEESVGTDIQQLRYIRNCGSMCPNCLGSNVESAGNLEADGNVATVDIHCNNCHSTWTDTYALVGFADLDRSSPLVIRAQSERGYYQVGQGWVFDVASATRFDSNTAPLDVWTFKPISSGNDAVLVDLDSAEDFLTSELSVGDEVVWNDPDNGLGSATYKIQAIHTQSEKLLHGSDVCFLKNESGSDAEVFARELS
jgi:hypothetical protein